MYNFDNVIARHGTNSMKWDRLKELYGREDLLPLWVADMDFEISPAISRTVQKRINHPIYGYIYIVLTNIMNP